MATLEDNIVREPIEPTISMPEDISNGLDDRRIGQQVKGIISYKVIDKTKSFVVLRIGDFHRIESKRTY